MKYYTDGYTMGGNPSNGGGYTVVDENGLLIETKVINKDGFTNNEAEIAGIERACELCAKGDSVSTDSMNSLTWVFSGRSKARPDLSNRLKALQNLVADKGINLCWERRDFNLAGIYNEKQKLDTGRDPKWIQKSLRYKRQKEKRRQLSLLPNLSEYDEAMNHLRSI